MACQDQCVTFLAPASIHPARLTQHHTTQRKEKRDLTAQVAQGDGNDKSVLLVGVH